MAIDLSSAKWESGDAIDWPVVHVQQLLNFHEGSAMSAEEITQKLMDREPKTVPRSLRDEYRDDNRAPLVSYVSSTLAHMQWRGLVDYRVVEENNARNVYYTRSDERKRYPIADIVDKIYPRLDDLEDDLDSEIDQLKARIQEVEYRVSRQEH